MEVHLSIEYIFTISAVLLLLGIFSSKLSSWVNTPALLMFLIVGMLAGSEGIARLGFIEWEGIAFSDYGVANFVGSLALCYILFSGGMDTKWRSIKSVVVTGGVLASLGVFLTALIMGLFAHMIFGTPLEFALLLGAIVSSTDAAAVFAILRSKSVGLKGKMQPLLELESGSNDPMAAFLTIFMISMINDPGQSYWVIFPAFVVRMTLGLLFGLAIGKLSARLFNKIALEYDGLYFVLGMGIVLLTYGLCEICGGNGFMATYACGLMMGNQRFLFKNAFKRFHDGISWLMQVVMFLLLGMLIVPSSLPGVAVEGIVLSLVLMFIARPVAVWICMLGKRFTNKERVLVSWGGLKGAAPIVLATFPAIAGVSGADKNFALVFFIVLTSVLIQGKTLMPVAKWLGLDKPLIHKAPSPLLFEETGEFASEMHEYILPDESHAVGKDLSELNLPKTSRVLLIRRDGGFVVPEGSTNLRKGDELLFLSEPRELKKTIAVLTTGKQMENE